MIKFMTYEDPNPTLFFWKVGLHCHVFVDLWKGSWGYTERRFDILHCWFYKRDGFSISDSRGYELVMHLIDMNIMNNDAAGPLKCLLLMLAARLVWLLFEVTAVPSPWEVFDIDPSELRTAPYIWTTLPVVEWWIPWILRVVFHVTRCVRSARSHSAVFFRN